MRIILEFNQSAHIRYISSNHAVPFRFLYLFKELFVSYKRTSIAVPSNR